MKKFWLFIAIYYFTLWMSQTFWYLEKTAFCHIENQNISIFFKEQDWTKKCKIYLDTVRQLSLERYNEVILIQKYISQWDDILYRKRILKEKESELLQLINLKFQIESYIKSFENTFFDKYKTIVKSYMESYYLDLETQYYILINQKISWNKHDTESHSLKISEIEQQMKNVSNILNSKSLDEMFDIFPNYIYLKQKLLWK